MDKCVLRLLPSEYTRREYGQDWPLAVYPESRDGLVTAASYDNNIVTIEILPFFT
jgi:hypothetical protein